MRCKLTQCHCSPKKIYIITVVVHEVVKLNETDRCYQWCWFAKDHLNAHIGHKAHAPWRAKLIWKSLDILDFKELCHEIYQNSNSGNPHQNEWNIKITAHTLHEGINNTANKKGDMDGQTWRRWKRTATGVFENRFSKLENS